MKRLLLPALVLAPLVAFAAGHPGAKAFQITSPDLTDNAIMPTPMAGLGKARDGSACGGANVSPALAWLHAPAGTQSFAVTMYDPDGGGGMGVSHWVAYDVPGTATSFAHGAATRPGPGYVGGKNQRGMATYLGPCPPAGDAWHHYTVQVFALDIPPGQLAPGLTRDALLAAIKGHLLAEASLVFRYTR